MNIITSIKKLKVSLKIIRARRIILFSLNHERCQKNLHDFFEHRFNLFGDYEDALHSEHEFNYHSLLSPSMNIGHLTPKLILKELDKFLKKKDIPLNSHEGFIRQIIGWREFIRGIYHKFDSTQQKANFFNHHRGLTEAWYTGETGIDPVDNIIKKINKNGYAHHIERLMVLSNIMLLCEVHPQQVYKWFMEMFVDSSDWVMGRMFLVWDSLVMAVYSPPSPISVGLIIFFEDEQL